MQWKMVEGPVEVGEGYSKGLYGVQCRIVGCAVEVGKGLSGGW